ncbi:MAG: heavy metal-binding domain-containing protein [Melioribacteraceae bacterium]|nr:heavy metal-binding domain-containing protein [Melioribacteraceae bacterium]
MKQLDLITTTSNIEGWKIERYCGIVTHQLVIGANLFKDMFSGIRDVVGGFAQGYQKELKKMEEVGLKSLSEKAFIKGANIIIGLRIDFDEISGGGKSMFMVSLYGTAIKGIPIDETKNVISNKIYSDTLEFLVKQEEFKEYYLNSRIKSIKTVNSLLKYEVDLTSQVFLYACSLENVDFSNIFEQIVNYFSFVPSKSISDFITSDTFLNFNTSNFKRIIRILNEIYWLDLSVIVLLFESSSFNSQVRTLTLLDCNKEYYDSDDIPLLKSIASKIENEFEQYPLYVDKKGVFGKEKKEWICPNCLHQQSLENATCGSCRYDIDEIKLKAKKKSVQLRRMAKKLEELTTKI